MVKRIITGFCLCVVMIPLLILGGWFFTIGAAILSYIAGWEMLNMMDKDNNSFKILKFVVPIWNAFTIILLKIYPSMILPTILIMIVACLMVSIIRPTFSIMNSIKMIFTYLYTGLSFVGICYIREINSDGYFNTGFYKLVYLVSITMMTDIGAYLIGRLIGKRKLCPTISPNKTIAGGIGGLVIGAGVGIAFYFIMKHFVGINFWYPFDNLAVEIILVIIFSLLLSFVSQIGDLVASKLKRVYDVKDYGFIFPGHGGVMDRFDSLILASFVFIALTILVVI